MMSAKALLTNYMTTETNQGRVRKRDTRTQSVFAVLFESRTVVGKIVGSPALLLTIALMVFLSIAQTIRGAFWSILMVEKLQVPDFSLALFYSARSIVMLLVYFLLMPRLRRIDLRLSIFWGFVGMTASQVILVMTPPGNYAMLALSTLVEAATFPIASTLVDTLVAIVVDAKERARIMALVYVIVIVFTSPFGYIAGQLSQIDRLLPFILNLLLFAAASVVAWVLSRRSMGGTSASESPEGETQPEAAAA
jgi:Na+/melibiose symporter-like transporter